MKKRREFRNNTSKKEIDKIENFETIEEVETRLYNIKQKNITAFCMEIGQRFAYIDYLPHIYNRNALERDFSNLKEDKGYCLIADLNDLKIANDTFVHSAGDG